MNAKKNDRLIVAALLSVTLLFRLWTVMMIHTGVDERDYWYSAKALTQGYSYPYVNHRTVRWGVILPVALQQLMTGIDANAYYVMPILNALAQTALLYALGKRLFNRRAGALAALFLVFFPYQIRAASQVRPEIFSITYVLVFLFFVHGYLTHENARKAAGCLAAAAVTLFIAYLTKITTLFFMPAVFVLIWMYRRKAFVRDSFLFGGILLALFVTETAVYRLMGDYPFGQLSVILSNHVADMDELGGFADVFKRYTLKNLQLYWQIPLWLFFAASAHALYARRGVNTVYLAVTAISFIFFVTFTPSSLHPLKMAEPFVNRYFSAALPAVFLVLASYLDSLLSRVKSYEANERPIAIAGLSGFILLCAVTVAVPLPSRLRTYIHSPFDREYHPFYLNAVYRDEINLAASAGLPIVALDSNGGNDALCTAAAYYLDSEYYVDDLPPAPSASIEVGGHSINSLGGVQARQGQDVLAVIRAPFRIRKISSDSLGSLDSEKFPE